jgi:hypothetical protein
MKQCSPKIPQVRCFRRAPLATIVKQDTFSGLSSRTVSSYLFIWSAVNPDRLRMDANTVTAISLRQSQQLTLSRKTEWFRATQGTREYPGGHELRWVVGDRFIGLVIGWLHKDGSDM